MMAGKRRTIGLLPWGDLIEDYLDNIHVSLEAFCADMTGGWLFGYVEALQLADVDTVIICFSGRVRRVTRMKHTPTGARMVIIPAPRTYRWIRKRMLNPYGWTFEDMFGKVTGARRFLYRLLRIIAPYLSTPLRALRRVVRDEGCDALLCQEYEYARFDTCVLLGKVLCVPVYASFQGGNWQTTRLEKALRPLAVRGSNGLIVAAGREVERVSASYGIAEPAIARIPNPLDLSVWKKERRTEAREALGIPQEARVAVWHGRVDMFRKGLDYLLDAWQQVRVDDSDQHKLLIIVGTGPDSDQVWSRIRSSKIGGIEFLDRFILDRNLIRRYLSAADAYVFVSRHEGFPSSVVEAMACELPVVTFSIPGVEDILEGGVSVGGILVDQGDVRALSAALKGLLEDTEEASRLGRLARARVESAFSYRTVGSRLRSFMFPP